jgi:hypothetical protein
MFPKFAQPEPTHLVIPRKAAFSKMGIGSYLEKGYFRETKVKAKKTKNNNKKNAPTNNPRILPNGICSLLLEVLI